MPVNNVFAGDISDGMTYDIGGVPHNHNYAPSGADSIAKFGNIITIVDDSDFNAFPSICRLADGTLFAVYRDATNHATSKGIIRKQTSTDDGITWSSQATIYSDAIYDARDPSISRLSSGRLMVSFFKYDYSGSSYLANAVHIIYSDDNGSTWSSVVQVTNTFTDHISCSSQVIELGNGDLLLATYGMDVGDTYDSSRISKSVDSGITWTALANIANGQLASRHYSEPNVILNPNGNLFCLMRSDTTHHFFSSISSDNGITWSAAVDAIATGTGSPRMLLTSSKLLVLLYRGYSPETVAYRLSWNYGVNWSVQINLDISQTKMNYAAMVEYRPGIIGAIYAAGPSDTDCNIYFQRLTLKVEYVELGQKGRLRNGRISVSVASNNLTVSLVTLAGNTPSINDPIWVRIGNTTHRITSALSITKNAGTNWFNSGCSGAGTPGLATNEIDYFVYMGFNSLDGVTIGFARIPYANIYSDFSATSTNEKYCAISTVANAAAGDEYEVIGRFAATLSATASFNWSVPTFTNINLIQTPTYETRWLSFTSAVSSSGGTITTVGTVTSLYQISGRRMFFEQSITITTAGSGSGHVNAYIPLTATNPGADIGCGRENAVTGKMLQVVVVNNTQVAAYFNYDNTYPAGTNGSVLLGSGMTRLV